MRNTCIYRRCLYLTVITFFLFITTLGLWMIVGINTGNLKFYDTRLTFSMVLVDSDF